MSNTFFQVAQLRFLHKGPYSFTLDKAESVGLSGPSGIGKTQLFRALTDLIPSSGTVSLSGKCKETIAAPHWRTKVMLVPSNSFWWYDTVGEHFHGTEGFEALGLSSESASWQVARLSTGEKQRLVLLRALQYKPELLLLDEPTSGLDLHHTELVENYLMQKRKEQGLTILWVSHDLTQLDRVADRLLYMETDKLWQG